LFITTFLYLNAVMLQDH